MQMPVDAYSFRNPSRTSGSKPGIQTKRTSSGFRGEEGRSFHADAAPALRQPENGRAAEPFHTEVTFASILCGANPAIAHNSPEALAHLPYQEELKLKQDALNEFWYKKHLPGKPAEIVPAPMPRNYRAISKRRAILLRSGKLVLSMGYAKHGDGSPAGESLLEPVMHNVFYRHAEHLLNQPRFQPLARAVNYLILRGAYEHCTMIVNIFNINGSIVRKIKQFAEDLKKLDGRLTGCFLYLDETRSDYYLEAMRPEKGVSFKKIFGSDYLDLRIRNRNLLYPPTVFSQVNEPMLPLFVKLALDLLKPNQNARFLDLYCGYGLFGLLAASDSASVIGMDVEGPAIEAAVKNAAYHIPDANTRYLAASITKHSLVERLPKDRSEEIVLLDPPRMGTLPGVIETIIARKPLRVLHIFCGTDAIPKELKIWIANGYTPRRVLPLDLFPGSINLETMILLERDPNAAGKPVTREQTENDSAKQSGKERVRHSDFARRRPSDGHFAKPKGPRTPRRNGTRGTL